jgi:hypothetical protein
MMTDKPESPYTTTTAGGSHSGTLPRKEQSK